MFANDVKTIRPRSVSAVRQEDIHTIHSWAQERDLPMNESKYCITNVGITLYSRLFSFRGDLAIEGAERTNDPRVHVDGSFKPSQHCVLAA